MMLKCNTVVVKIASRCNLNCTYCYMYNMGDETYHFQPKRMSMDTVQELMNQILVHCQTHDVKKFTIVLHGGEPLLAGEKFFKNFMSAVRKTLSSIEVKTVLQTNGTLINESWCQTLSELGINVGVSLDGTQESNDRHRIDHAGKGSYNHIIKGLKTLQNSKFVKNKPGILCVIDVQNSPIGVYEHFKALGIESADFLLPETTYEKFPSGKENFSQTSYGDWLIALFDKWFYDSSTNRIKKIRFFDQIIHMLLGGIVSSDSIGDLNNQVLVIETDGGIEAVDALKVCGDGFTKCGANVSSHTFDQAIDTELANLYHLSHTMLCAKCAVCPIRDICGGGYLPHRFSIENGFDNPSVYCHDLIKLITHIQNQLLKSIPKHLVDSMEIEPMKFDEIMEFVSQEYTHENELEGKYLESFKQKLR